MAPIFTPHAFVQKWRQSTLKEKSGYVEHFIDLCRLVGHPTPAEDDPTGKRYAFEAGATKQGGGQGWADVWKRDFFALEYKGKNANLDTAYDQLLKYRESLVNPPLLIVCDFDQLVVHTNFTRTVKKTYPITLDDLLTPQGQQQLRAIFYDPEFFKAPQTTDEVTREAARQFARLAELLRKYGESSEAAAHFLIQLLFALFAEDVGLLPAGLFSRLIVQMRSKPVAFAAQVRLLFDTMATGGWFGADEIRHFNGRLFDGAAVLELDSEGLDVLARVSQLDWAAIEPSIFGTLFERSLDPAKRAQLGAHYTSKDDILLIVEPVLMAPLRRRWGDVDAQARALATKRDAASGGQRTRLQHDLQALLVGFAGEIAGVRVLDPACGSGNFLYVALKQLLDLEKAVIQLAGDLAVGTFFPTVGPEQLRGIEVNEYAHELAQITVWIGYIQWLRDNGFGYPSEPILKPLDTIQRMDAILAYDAQGWPVEPTWPVADVVIGNPPFLGGKRLRSELGNDYVDAIFALYDGRVPREADLVTYWFERARALLTAGGLQRAGLLATQAIRGGANRKVLERIKATGDIFMAWSDRKWIVDGAAVQVSMVGFDRGIEQDRTLNGSPVTAINANLTGATDLTQARRLRENAGIAFMGDTKGGAFDISADVAARMIATPLNPNGRPNTDVVRPWVNGLDITRRLRGMWIVDFGIAIPEDEAALYEQPYEHVRAWVKPERLNNNRAAYRERWWLHVEPRPALRAAVAPLQRFIATPNLTKHRLFAWLQPPTLPDHQLIVFARDDDYFFGVLHSRMHELWARAQGTQLREAESGFRYTPSTTFETFPFPWPPGTEPASAPRVTAIAQAAANLVAKRDAWLNPPGASEAELKKRTLTNLYNARPTWLALLHQALDRAVLDAYGWPHDLSDEAILARLLTLNLERAATQGGAAPATATEEATDG